ncbi:hypothetical protein STEG23_024344, partial [Scotinomys teguina]
FQDNKSATNIQSIWIRELKQLKTMDTNKFRNDIGQAIQCLVLSLFPEQLHSHRGYCVEASSIFGLLIYSVKMSELTHLHYNDDTLSYARGPYHKGLD